MRRQGFACRASVDASLAAALPPFRRFAGTYFVRCAAHAVDLAFEDIFKLDYFKDAATAMRQVVTYIKNHHATTAAWKELEGTTALLLPATTRFGTNYIMLQRASQMGSKLQQLVVSDAWAAFVSNLAGRDAKDSAAAVKQTVLDAQLFSKIGKVRGCPLPVARCALRGRWLGRGLEVGVLLAVPTPARTIVFPPSPRSWLRWSPCISSCASWMAMLP